MCANRDVQIILIALSVSKCAVGSHASTHTHCTCAIDLLGHVWVTDGVVTMISLNVFDMNVPFLRPHRFWIRLLHRTTNDT
jgi:hypothetical protein